MGLKHLNKGDAHGDNKDRADPGAPFAQDGFPSRLRNAGRVAAASTISPAGTIKRETSGQKSSPASKNAQIRVPRNTVANSPTAEDLRRKN